MTVCGVLAGPAPITGDETEYYAMTWAVATHGAPTLTPDVTKAIRAAFPGRSPLEPISVRAPDGTYDALHFWFFSALASPFFLICRAVGMNWQHCFAALNALCCAIATGVIFRYFRPFVATLLLVSLGASPVFVYLNKAHPETFSVMLVAAAMIFLARRRPLAAALMLSIVAAQISVFSPLAVLLLLYWAFLMRREKRKPSRPETAMVAVCVGLLSLQPVWSIVRHHTLNVIISAGYVQPQMATLRRVCAMLFDPDVGLLFVWPLAPAVGIVTLYGLAHHRDLLRRYRAFWLFAIVTTVLLSYAGAQQVNFTSSVTRYSLWLIPLFLISIVLVFEEMIQVSRSFSRRLAILLLAGSLASLGYSYASVGLQPALRRRPLAQLWYRYFPSLYDPDEQVFAELALGQQRVNGLQLFVNRRYPVSALPDSHIWAVSNHGCTKLLVLAYAFTSSAVQPLAPAGCTEPVDAAALLRYARRHGVAEMRDQYVTVPAGEIEQIRLQSPSSLSDPEPDHPPKVESIAVESGLTQELIWFLRVSDPDGWQDIDSIFLSADSAGDEPGGGAGCQLVYKQPGGDVGLGVSKPRPGLSFELPGQTGLLRSDFCGVDTSRVKVTAMGDGLTVILPVEGLDPRLTASGMTARARVTDLAQQSSEWVPWSGVRHEVSVSASLVVEKAVMEPGHLMLQMGGSSREVANLSRLWILINRQLDPAHGCYILVEPVSRTLYLTPDSGDTERAIPSGFDSRKSLSNTQCKIDLRDSTLTMTPTRLDLRLSISSAGGLKSQPVWAAWQYASGRVAPWRQIGNQ